MSDPAPTPRDHLAELLGDIERLQAIFASWEDVPRRTVEAYRRAIETLHGEALRRLIRSACRDPAALAALKAAAADEVVYAVLRHHELVKPSLNERIEVALATIRPMLAAHGGDVRLVTVAPPSIEVEMIGACGACASAKLTFHAGVKKAIQDACPEITEVLEVSGRAARTDVRFVSPFNGDGTWLPAGVLGDIPEDGVRATQIGGEPVVLVRRGAVVSCFQDACAHLGLAFHDGTIDDGVITCPHHGFRYHLATGECLTAPEVQLQVHAVRVVGDRVEVRLAR